MAQSVQVQVASTTPKAIRGIKLVSRKIKGKAYRVMRGYQSGDRYDFIRGHKITHAYADWA